MSALEPSFSRNTAYFWRIRAYLAALSTGLCLLACGDGVGQPIREAAISTPPDGGMNEGDVPNSAYCQDVKTWPESDAADEQSLFATLDALRLIAPSCTGAGFGGFGGFGGTSSLPTQGTPLTRSPELRCSARRHARDMAQRGYFSQTTPEGETPEARTRLAGYSASLVTEVIARDQALPFQVLEEQLRNGGCEALVDPRLVAVGVGNFENFWTIDLAGARAP
jgi:hypothetical protein